MEAIKAWLDTNPGDIQSLVTDIEYSYATPLNVYKSDTSEGVVQVNPATGARFARHRHGHHADRDAVEHVGR